MDGRTLKASPRRPRSGKGRPNPAEAARNAATWAPLRRSNTNTSAAEVAATARASTHEGRDGSDHSMAATASPLTKASTGQGSAFVVHDLTKAVSSRSSHFQLRQTGSSRRSRRETADGLLIHCALATQISQKILQLHVFLFRMNCFCVKCNNDDNVISENDARLFSTYFAHCT